MRTPEPGQDVQLTVDAGIQSIVYREALAVKEVTEQNLYQ